MLILNRKSLSIYLLLTFIVSSCDPGESLEANIINNTSQDLKINFVSTEIPDLNESFEIKSNNKVLYDEFGGIGDANLSFEFCDSIYIQNSSNEVLKVFKQDTPGKNIYNVDEYWTVREPSKNHFVYTYEITDGDIE